MLLAFSSHFFSAFPCYASRTLTDSSIASTAAAKAFVAVVVFVKLFAFASMAVGSAVVVE